MKFTQAKVNAFRPPPGKREHEEIDDAMPGFGIRWRANGNGGYGEGAYFFKTKVGTKHSRPSLGKISKVPLVEAQADAREQFALAARKINPGTERRKAVAKVNDTLGDHISSFVAYLRDDKKRSAPYVAEVQRTLSKSFAPLHRFNSADIDVKMVSDQLDRIKVEVSKRPKGGDGASTSDHCRSHLSSFFRWLIIKGKHRGSNPVISTATNGYKPRKKLLDIRKEVRLIWAALPPPGDDYGDIVRLLFLLGPRKAEIAGLARAEVNFKAKWLEIPGTRTKSGRDFVVPLSEPALAVLKARAGRVGLIFGRGERIFTNWSWAKQQLDERAGVTGWVLHDSRRLLSTVMNEVLDPPVDPHVVEACLGHVVGGVAGVYNRAQYVDQKREALERYAKYFLKLVEAKPVRAKARPARRRSKQSVVELGQ